MTRSPYAIHADALLKRFGARTVVDGVDLAVPWGSVHGLLGHNGAGKSTIVRMLTTLIRPDGGSASVAGFDVARESRAVRRHFGLVGQHAAVDEILGGRENLVLFGRLFHLSGREAKRRADDLLERFGLTEAAGRPVATYSGGMRRRLDLAASLIMAPPVLFLDEPTTGLDPRSRIEVWEAVRALVAQGTTVLLTTQYLEEADRLANRITVVGTGRVIAEGSADELKARVGGDRIEVVLAAAEDLLAGREIVGRVAGSEAELDLASRRISARTGSRGTVLTDTFGALVERGIAIEDIGLRRPTLDDVFLHLTGETAPDTASATEHAA